MSRAGPPPNSRSLRFFPNAPPALPHVPASSLDRIEVAVHYNTGNVYRMETAERWRGSPSADAPVVFSTFSFFPDPPPPVFALPHHSRRPLIQVLPWMKLYFTVPLYCFADAVDLRLFRNLIRKQVTTEVKLRA